MLDTIDAVRFPRLAEYVRALPQGLASYPECRSKGALVATALEGHAIGHLDDGLPREVVAMLRDPPMSWLWIPAPLSDAVFYVLVDTYYPTPDAMLEWTYERTMKASRSKMYRALTRVAGPSALIRMAAAAHGLFQKGTDLAATPIDQGVDLLLTHPPHLHGGFNHLSNIALFQALVEITGARDGESEMLETTPTHARYRVTWR